jgi:DNA-binding transcriptional MerR regulator
MAFTVAAQVDLKSNGNMGLVGIGEAARTLGLNPSALRYYEERGLIRPVTRHSGRRMYDTGQLRRLVLVQMMQQLGVHLDAAAAIMDQSSDAWRDHLAHQITELDDLIARATMARDFLAHARNCPADHPVDQCPKLIEVLDRRLAGVSFEEIVREYSGGDAVVDRDDTNRAGSHPD